MNTEDQNISNALRDVRRYRPIRLQGQPAATADKKVTGTFFGRFEFHVGSIRISANRGVATAVLGDPTDYGPLPEKDERLPGCNRSGKNSRSIFLAE